MQREPPPFLKSVCKLFVSCVKDCFFVADGINDNSGAGDEDYDSKEDLFDKKRLSLIN